MTKMAFLLLLAAAANLLGQTPAKDPDTIQALLVEVRQLRQDIEAMTVASQRVQIALYALQMQDAAVARATQRADGIKNQCTGAEMNRGRVAADIQRMESALASGKLPDNETKDVQMMLASKKGEIETATAEAQTCQATETEASGQLRNERARLSELQERIARLDQALEKLGGSPR